MIVTEFTERYNAIVALIQSRLTEDSGDERDFESSDIVEASFTGLPRQLILGLQPDEKFIGVLYFKILDREAEPDEFAMQVERLATSSITRDALIHELTACEEAVERNVRIQWVED